MTLEQKFDSGRIRHPGRDGAPEGRGRRRDGRLRQAGQGSGGRLSRAGDEPCGHAHERPGGRWCSSRKAWRPSCRSAAATATGWRCRGTCWRPAPAGSGSVVVVGGEDTELRRPPPGARGPRHQPPSICSRPSRGLQGRPRHGGRGAERRAGVPRGRRRPTPAPRAARPNSKSTRSTQRAAAGARFFITPPVFDLELIQTASCGGSTRSARSRHPHRAAAEIPGHGPLHGAQHAAHLAAAGDHRAASSARPTRSGSACASPSTCAARIKAEGFRGVVLSTLGWEHKLPDIVEAI
ncbi:MAG: hypothetical protein MZU91_08165 [Desulfosudis oleivorans]|nr:hypothetical protein [Desulfosudis oleivorans]